MHRKADVAFSGHNHYYERSVANGVQYIVTGGGGAPGHSIDLGWDYDGTPGAVREAWYDKDRTDKGDWHHHCRISVSANGDVVVDVFNNEHTLLDSFEIP